MRMLVFVVIVLMTVIWTSGLWAHEQPIHGYVKITMEVTAYCPCKKCCGKFADGVTATGVNAYTKGVAVDPKKIPLGSTVKIPGYGTVKADDVGGAIKGNRLDVRFNTHKEALQWGRRTVVVFIKRPGK